MRRTAHGVRKKNLRPSGGGSVLTGSGGEGGPEGWTPRGGSEHEQRGSLSTGERCPTGSGLKLVGVHDVRRARAAGRQCR
jgi:hypothetical protein